MHIALKLVIVVSDNEVYGWGSGKHGRLGLGHIEDARVPTQLQLDGAKLNFHSLSVCHSSTLIVGQGLFLFIYHFIWLVYCFCFSCLLET